MKDSDLWGTIESFFEELDKEFHFLIDICADENNCRVSTPSSFHDTKCYAKDYLNPRYDLLEEMVEYHYNGYDYDRISEGIHYDNTDAIDEESAERLRNDILDGDFSAFMNPPYSNPKPFIEKAWEDSKEVRIVCLLKCDTSTSWWSIFWDYDNNKPKDGCEVRFLPKRLKFERNGVPGGTCNFHSVIVIMDRRGD